MGYKAGYVLKVKIGDTALVGLRSKELSLETELAEATTDDSTGQYREYVPLQKGGTISVDGLYNPDLTGEGLSEVIGYLKNGTSVTVYFGGVEAGDTYEQSSGYISSVTWSGDNTDLQNYSVEIQLSGEITTSTAE